MIQQRNLAPELRNIIRGAGNPFAGFWRDWFVDANNGDDGYDGKSWDAPFKTISQAMTAAALDAGDVRIKAPRILVAPGDYDEGVVIDMNIENMILQGCLTSPNNHATMLYSSSATHDLIEIGAHNVKIYDMGLVQTKARDAIQLGDAASESWWKLHIAGCKFDGWGTCTYGINAFDATVDCPDMVIEGNLFRSIATTSISVYATRAWVINNRIFVDANAIGIDYQSTGGDRPDAMITGNWILGSNSGDTGIKFASTEPTDGTHLTALNVVTNCATLITKGKGDAGVVCNYTYADGAALAQADPT